MELIYHVACSLDGFIATDDDGVQWLEPFQGGDEDYGLAEFMNSVHALVMGRRTYDVACGFGEWPMGDTPTFVMTSHDAPVVHESITITNDAPDTFITRMQDAGHTRAWFMGGGVLARSFMEHGLITECVFSVMPVVLGSGIPLFAAGTPMTTMTRTGVTTFDDGVTVLRYAIDS